MYIFNEAKKEFELVSHKPLLKNIHTICEDNNGRLWLGVKGHAPVLFNTQNNEAFNYDSCFSSRALRSFNKITSVLYTTTNELVIGTFNDGLYIFHPKSGRVEHLLNNYMDQTSLSFNHVLSLYEDRAQNLWIGTLKGLNKLNLKPKKFETFRLNNDISLIEKDNRIMAVPNVIISVFVEDSGLIWLGAYMNSLYTINPKTKKIDRFDSIQYRGESVWAIYKISKEYYLLGTNYGLNLININSKSSQFIPLANDAGNANYWVRAIVPTAKNKFWVATLNKGLLLFDLNEKRISVVSLKYKKSKKIFKKDILSLYKDHSGILWIGTQHSGLFFYNSQTEELFPFSDKRKYFNNEFKRINSITEDTHHQLWVGSENGLICIKQDRKNIMHYSVQNGLSNSYIYAVQIDNQNNIWVSSNGGLSKIHINKYGASLVYNYTMNDGLQANEFNTNCSFKDRNGNLYFGGIDGLNIFDPRKIYSNPHIPVVAVNWINVNNKIISPVNEKTKITIDPYHSNLEFVFSALDFTNPANNRYAYKLDGFDSDWLYNGTKHSVRYTGLTPGEYIFYFKGTNNDGLWSKSAFVNVTVLTPFWETAWAMVLYILLLIIGIIVLIMLRTRKVNKDRDKLNRKVKEITGELQKNYQKLEETRTELINSVKRKAVEVLADGMAHDFNNLLFVILSSAQLLEKSVESPEIKKLVKNIEIAAIDASSVIKRIQDFSTNKENASREIVDINHVLLDVVGLIKSKIKEKEDINNIIITIKKDIHVNWVTYGNVSDFRVALTNILINAVDAFDSSGRITITSRFDGENKGIIEISDEGRGMPKEILNNIFDPFYTTKGVHGSGLGLSQAYGIITRHNGSIKAESEIGRGTKIIITLPANPKILNLHSSAEESDGMHRKQNKNNNSILIIEDELTIRELYEEILSIQGYPLQMAETGEEGLAKWENGDFNLIICDLGLPGLLSGWDVIEEVRKQNKQIPILVVTGWGNTIEEEKIELYQVDKVLTKPVPIQELIREVSSLISR